MCLGAPGPLWADKEGQIRQLSGPNASHAEGLSRGARGGKSAGSGWTLSPFTQGMAGRARLLFPQSQKWQTEQLRWLGRTKERK